MLLCYLCYYIKHPFHSGYHYRELTKKYMIHVNTALGNSGCSVSFSPVGIIKIHFSHVICLF